MGKHKRFIGYFIYVIFIGVMLLKGGKYETYFRGLANKTYDVHPHVIFLVSYSVIMGILLAIPNLVNTLHKQGTWSFNWIKFFSIGIPALLLTVLPVLFVFFNLPIIYSLYKLFYFSTIPSIFSGIIFGYLISLCVKKNNIG